MSCHDAMSATRSAPRGAPLSSMRSQSTQEGAITLLRVSSTAFVFVILLSVGAFAQTAPARTAPRASVEKAAAPVNLNTATVAELERLPGIGPKVAARIVDYRTKKGPFRKTEELMNVQGIGEKSFLKLRAQLTVSAPASASQQ